MIKRVFNLAIPTLSRESGRKPIKERGITWKEAYQKRSAPLKKRFDHDIGPGAYHRWEGHDYTTNSDYYVVVGPSIQRGIGKMFFAGIKKLPPDWKKENKKNILYSPYGKYFTNIKSALSYATQRWAVPFPQDQAPYAKEDLERVDIPEHIKA